MMDKFMGKWKQEREENLDAFLAAKGVPWFARKMAGSSALHMIIEDKQEEGYRLYQYTTFRTIMDLVFKLNIELDFKQMDGAACKAKFFFEDEKLIQENKVEGLSTDRISREILPDGTVLQTMTAGDIVCKRFFKKE